ncbi:MAG: ECF transporter S component [Firmicutes bacterium]|nr:ECF transporter S component [Bacillota bacterium]
MREDASRVSTGAGSGGDVPSGPPGRGEGDSRRLALSALMLAMVVVATMIRIPAPTYRLYFNLGEAVVYTTALLFGRKTGALIAGVGSALSDLLLGYPIWAPFTFVIKGAEGYVVGAIASRAVASPWPEGGPDSRPGNGGGVRNDGRRDLMAVALGAPIMIAGYAASAWILYGLAAVPVELGGDVIQCFVGALVAIPLARTLRRTGTI